MSSSLEALGCAPRVLQRSFLAREDFLDALVDPHDRVVREVTDRFRASLLEGHARLLLAPSVDRVAKRRGQTVPGERRLRLRALAEGAGDGVAGGANAELGLQVRETLPDGVRAQEQLPSEFSFVHDHGGRTEHLGLAPSQTEAIKRLGAEARDLFLEQQRVRIAREQTDGEAPAVAIADKRRARGQRQPLGDGCGQPASSR